MVTMVWAVSRFRLKAHPGISSSCISPLTHEQRSRASWASQPQKSATLSPQPGGKPRKFLRTCGGIGGKKTCLEHYALIIMRSKLHYTVSDTITPIGGRPVQRLREDLCTGRPPTGAMTPEAAQYNLDLPMMCTTALETCRGI